MGQKKKTKPALEAGRPGPRCLLGSLQTRRPKPRDGSGLPRGARSVRGGRTLTPAQCTFFCPHLLHRFYFRDGAGVS